MIFKKKKDDMIDVRTLQKRGVVNLPKKDIVVPTDSNGFIELGKSKKESPKSNMQFFGFNQNKTTPSEQFSTESDGYNKREVDSKIINLDNKIYKLEQRVELLERKIGVSQTYEEDNNSENLIGW